MSNQNITKKTLDLALPSMIVGILSIAMAAAMGVVLGIVGIILANNTIKKYNEAPYQYEPEGFNQAKIGRTCSIIGIVLCVLFWVGYILFWFFYAWFIMALSFMSTIPYYAL